MHANRSLVFDVESMDPGACGSAPGSPSKQCRNCYHLFVVFKLSLYLLDLIHPPDGMLPGRPILADRQAAHSLDSLWAIAGLGICGRGRDPNPSHETSQRVTIIGIR